MPPKKKRPLVWMPLTWKAILPAGDIREYYLPLSKEEIEKDLELLGSLLAQASGKRRAVGGRALAAQHPASSEELSPSSQQGEDENESGNPSDQHMHSAHQAAAAAAAQWAGGHKTGVLAGAAAGQVAAAAAGQQQAGMV